MTETAPARSFLSDGVRIAFRDTGEEERAPVLLIHGFASNKDVNWAFPGWTDTLSRAGYRVIAVDNRGHGESEKLYDPALYSSPIMAEDARRLLDHLGIGRAVVMGYSMGARIAAFLAMAHPDRVRAAIFGGLGLGMVEGVGPPDPIVAALEAPTLRAVEDPVGRAFRAFAEQTKSDLAALAACMRSARQTITPAELGRIAVPVLVVVGALDTIAKPAEPLAALIPGARAVTIPRRDHMTAVGDRAYKEAVLAFLAEIGADRP